MSVSWLEPDVAAALVQVSATDEDADWVGALAASRAYVVSKRKDLYVGAPPVFTPTDDVVYGTAMLAKRWYARRVSPLGTSQNVEFGGSDFLRQDPDIAKLLGIGSEGKPVFGGARAAELDALLVEEA